jgi:RHS repeat-associated protein
VHSDWLGTERVRSGSNAVGCLTTSNNPFGDGQATSGTCDVSPQHFTGKERDAESGLDYFTARYYSSNTGRFMSPDSTGYSGLTNPQSWNLYAYTLNNPLRYIDPSGHTVECTNEAAACLAAAQAAVGKDAAGQLTSKTTQNWFQKIFGTSTTTLQITGNEADFRAASGNASKLADLIDSKTNFEVSIQQNTSPSGDGLANKILGGGGFNMQGGSQAYTPSEGYLPSIFIDPRWQMDKVDTDSIRDGIPPPNMGEKFAHELLGHVWGEVFGGHSAVRDTSANGRDAVNAENEVRRTDPSRGQKTEHHHD